MPKSALIGVQEIEYDWLNSNLQNRYSSLANPDLTEPDMVGISECE